MKINYFGLSLESDDFDMESPQLVSDFNFQVNYVADFIGKRLKNARFESDAFNMIMIKGRKYPGDNVVLQEHFKTLVIEVRFDKTKYQRLYPVENVYPLEDLLKPLESVEEFNDFLIGMIMEGLKKGRRLKAPIPYDFLVNTVLDFKSGGCKNEWVQKAKTFKEFRFKASLFCTLTVNYFSL